MSAGALANLLRNQGVDRAVLFTVDGFLRDDWREALYAAKKYRNIILQFCGVPLSGMRQIVAELGWDRCVFGSDGPFDGNRMTAQMISQIDELDIPPQGKEAILGRNMAGICRT